MYSTVELDSELKAIYLGGSKGSEILLFQRNVGLVGRFNVPETGEDAEALLQSIKQECALRLRKVNSWSLMERILRKFFALTPEELRGEKNDIVTSGPPPGKSSQVFEV